LTQISIDTGTDAQLCHTRSIQSGLTQRLANFQNPETAANLALKHNPNIKALEKQAESLEAFERTSLFWQCNWRT